MLNIFQQHNKTVLISGCGGGYDVFCGLTLMFDLVEKDKRIVLGNYSFTDDKILKRVGEKVHSNCYKITRKCVFDQENYVNELIKNIDIPPKEILLQIGYTKEEYIGMMINENSQNNQNSQNLTPYFPEYYLVKALYQLYKLDITIYCFVSGGIRDLTDAYQKVVDVEEIDTIVLIDGGTDALMTGNETNEKGELALGTPFEDISSIISSFNTTCQYKYLCCLGFNVDSHHGVTDENFLKNTSVLKDQGYFLGSYSLSPNKYKYRDVFMRCYPENSIVNSLIVSAIEEHFGDHKPSWIRHRLGNTKQNITHLMTFYWVYELDGIYKNLKYNKESLKNTQNEVEVNFFLKFFLNN